MKNACACVRSMAIFGAAMLLGFAQAAAADESLDRNGTQWAPYLEWRLEHPTYEGNPYDVEATATFVHAESGEQHTTGMFYGGADAWKFRFTGTRTGAWSFSTSSPDEDLESFPFLRTPRWSYRRG